MKCVGYPQYDNCNECELTNEACHPSKVKRVKEQRKTRGSFAGLERKALERVNKLTKEQEKMAERISLDMHGWMHPNPALTDDEFFGKLKLYREHTRKIEKWQAKVEEYRQKQVIKDE